jgi:formylglycine-generating enzyme required for sulfatase activity
MIPEYDTWLAQARELIDGRPAAPAKGIRKRPSLAEHKAKLAELRSKARPLTPEQAQSEREKPASEAGELDGAGGERRTFEYDDPEAAWWDRQLSKLVEDLEALRDPDTGLMGDTLAEPFGWGVTKRHGFAQTIEASSVLGADAETRWTEANAAIRASPKYGGLELKPQVGLIPLGPDPDSGLWEFAHLQTGEPAVRGADGKLVLTEATGLVFVLLPGGKSWLGAQRTDRNGHNFDPQARLEEAPVREIELAPYFLSKYEMTQGQWQRITAHDPSYYQPPNKLAPTLLHPVEQVSWLDCETLTARLGLSLPSEAQWEYGARGEMDTPWWTGAEREALRGMVNLADQSAKRAGAPWSDIGDWPDLDDGSAVHAEVGHYAANGFGLCEVTGNVWEWCLDGHDDAPSGNATRLDPAAPGEGTPQRYLRGGSYNNAASYARSANRYGLAPVYRGDDLGLRPARRITPQ